LKIKEVDFHFMFNPTSHLLQKDITMLSDKNESLKIIDRYRILDKNILNCYYMIDRRRSDGY